MQDKDKIQNTTSLDAFTLQMHSETNHKMAMVFIGLYVMFLGDILLYYSVIYPVRCMRNISYSTQDETTKM